MTYAAESRLKVTLAIHKRWRIALLLLTIPLALAVAGCNVAHRSDSARSGMPSDYGAAPNFRLPNIAGGTFELTTQAAAHRAVVLTFVTADCKEECPKVEAILRAAAQRLDARHLLGRSVEIATIELDPKTNSVASVRALRRKLWPRRGWAFLRGSAAQTAPTLRDYQVYVQPRKPGKDLVHSSYVYVIDDRMRQIDVLGPRVNLTPAAVVADAQAAIAHRAPPGVAVGGR